MAKHSPAKAAVETYQDVVERLKRAWSEGSPEAKKAARIARRLHWLCRLANWPPETTSASLQAARAFFDANQAASFGVTPATYTVYRSEILSALRPEPVRKGRYILQMTGPYRAVHDLTVKAELPPAFRWRSTPFLWYLHDHGICPSGITSETLTDYYRFCLEVELLPEDRARRRAQDAGQYISLMAEHPAFADFGFGPVAISFRNHSIKYDVPRHIADALLAEFDGRVVPWVRGEMSNRGESWRDYITRLDAGETKAPTPVSDKKAAWKASQAYQRLMEPEAQVSRSPARGFLSPDRRWAPTTIANRRDLCSTCTKVMYEAGQFHLETIEELTDPEIVEVIAQRLHARRAEDNPQSSYSRSVITFIITLARDFIGRPQADLDRLQAVLARYAPARKGIAPKNKATLRRFTEARIQALVDLPDQILREVNREVQKRRESYRSAHGVLPKPVEMFDAGLVKQIMLALATHIMLARAPRRSNLSCLRLDWIRWREGLATLEIPPAFVKGRRAQDGPLLIPLDGKASRLLDQYLQALRAKILHAEDSRNPYLFPSPPHAGRHRIGGCYDSLPDRLVDQVHERVGVRINPHLWRHLIGWIWLREDPDKLAAVQKLLGHKNIQTTIDYYADIDESVVLNEWLGYLDGKKKKA